MKKWTYLVAAGMLLGATPVFTGCIDNDEPEGITILRGAKAELLKAKSAVEAAKVAEVQANAALIQAKAKVEEANATKIQAEAKKVEAEAKIAEAQAALINAQTESEKARLQGIIEENQRAQKEWEENAAVRAAEAEAAIQEAEYKALQAKAEYQQALVYLQSAQQRVLRPYITALNDATEDYFDALEDLRVAQRELNKQQVVVDEREASKELYTRRLQKRVNVKESAVKGQQEALAVAEEELAAAKTMKPSDLAVKQEEIEGKITTVMKELTDLNLKYSETIAGFYTGGRFADINGLYTKYADAMDASQTIAAVEFDFGDGAGYPMTCQRGKLSLLESTYSYNYPVEYESRLEQLTDLLAEFKSWTRDENDNAWTLEAIKYMEGALADYEKEIATAKKQWQEAVAAYNTNKYNTSDMTKISGYKEVESKIAAFNEAAGAVNDARAKVKNLEDKEKADKKTRDEAWKANEKAETTAKEAAKTAFVNANNALDATYTAKKEALKKTMDDAKKDFDAKEKAYETEFKKDPNSAATKTALAAWTEAESVYNKATDANKAYTKQVEADAIKKVKDDADLAAEATRTKADKAAKDAYDKLWDPAKGTDTAALAAAEKDVIEKAKALDTAQSNLIKASNTYNNNISEYHDATNTYPIVTSIIDAIADNTTIDSKKGYIVIATDLTTAKLIVLDKMSLIYAVQVRSKALFGNDLWEMNQYGDFEARLKDLKDEDILKLIDEAMDKVAETNGYTTLSDYLTECKKYGKIGLRLEKKELIRIANSWLSNSELINGKIKQAQDAIDKLTAEYDKNEKAIEAQYIAYADAWDALEADVETAKEPIEKKKEELEPLRIVYLAIQKAITRYEKLGEEVWTDSEIQDYITECETTVETAKNDLYDAETCLMWAKEHLEKWNSGALDQLGIQQELVDNAQALVDRKKKELDNAQAALDAMLANLSVE